MNGTSAVPALVNYTSIPALFCRWSETADLSAPLLGMTKGRVAFPLGMVAGIPGLKSETLGQPSISQFDFAGNTSFVSVRDLLFR
jgi:hypothetical protein